jgi:transcriptional regulator with XRE-family HTH domain
VEKGMREGKLMETTHNDLQGFSIGIKLSTLRHRKGLSRKALGKKISFSPVSIYTWESERNFPSDIALERIRQFYGLPFTFFMEDKIRQVKTAPKRGRKSKRTENGE